MLLIVRGPMACLKLRSLNDGQIGASLGIVKRSIAMMRGLSELAVSVKGAIVSMNRPYSL